MSIRETSAEIESAAVEWVARLESESVSPADQVLFEAWISQSERRLGAYTRARAMWMVASEVGQGLNQDCTAVERIQEFDEAHPTIFSRRNMIAASIAAVFLGVLNKKFYDSSFQHVLTMEGEQQRLSLGNGKSVMLDSQSALTMRCKSNICESIELSSGQSLFSNIVGTSPLIVQCRDTLIKTLDGRFSVTVEPIGIRIIVTHGIVYLLGEYVRDIAVAAGREALVSLGNTTIRKLDREEIERSIAWSTGYLIFSGETLADAVRKINRYNHIKIGLGRGAPPQQELVGRFSINDPRNFAEAVAAICGLRVRKEGNWLVLESSTPE